MAPIDELTGEELDQEELDYRRTLRDAVSSGALKGTPQPDDTWKFDPLNEPTPAPVMPDSSEIQAEPPQRLPDQPPPIAEVSPQAAVEEKTPPEQQLAQDIASRAQDELVGLKDRTSDQDYISLTNGITMGFGPEGGPRMAKLLYDAVSRFDDTHIDPATLEKSIAAIGGSDAPDNIKATLIKQLQSQASRPSDRQVALGAFQELFDQKVVGYTPEGAQTAYDHMLEVAKDNFGNANPNVLQIATVAAAVGSGGISGLLRGGAMAGLKEAGLAGASMAVSQGADEALPEGTPDWARELAVTTAGAATFSIPSSGVIGGFAIALGSGTAATLATEAGVPAGPEIPGVGSVRDLAAMFAGGAASGYYVSRWNAVQRHFDEATVSGEPNAAVGVTPEMALRLHMHWERVLNAAPNDMVTVFHAADEPIARKINDEGIKPNSYFSSDPEMAMAHSIRDGDANPTLLAFQIKRSELNQTAGYQVVEHGRAHPVVFQGKGRYKPMFNQATEGFIENAAGVLKDFLHGNGPGQLGGGLASETGSFLTPGKDEAAPIPPDVEALAYGSNDQSQRAQIGVEGTRTPSFGPNKGVEVKTFGTTTNPDGSKSYWRSMDDLLEKEHAKVEGRSPEELAKTYADHRAEAGKFQDIIDELESRIGTPGEKENTVATRDLYREKLYTSLKNIQGFGEELYARTDGKEGLQPKIKQAINQFLAAEEGRITLPGLPTNPSQSNRYNPGSVPATETVKLLGVKPINPRLRPIDIIGNILPKMKGDVPADAMGTQLVIEDKHSRNNMESTAKASVSEMSYYAYKFFKAEKGTHHILEFKKAGIEVTLQDLADKWDSWRGSLSPEQNYALGRFRDIMETYNKALKEQGIELGNRVGIEKGGFYLPRGDGFEDSTGLGSVTAYQDDHIKLPRGHSPTKSFERTAIFDSMVEGQKNGIQYLPFEQVMDTHFKRAGERILDKHWANVLQNTRDEHGNLIWTSAELRLAHDNPKLADRMRTLRDQVASLDKSLDTLDRRTHATIKKYLYEPAPDLTALKGAADRMVTKNGTLRVRDLGVPQLTVRQNAMELIKEVNHELFVSRGNYKGMTGAEARRQAFKDKVEQAAIGRGRFKGITFDQGQALLNNIKSTLNSLEPAWKAAKLKAAEAGDILPGPGGQGEQGVNISSIGFGKNLSGAAFPKTLASVINAHFDEMGPPRGSTARLNRVAIAVNNLMRMTQASMDFSAMGIQGLLGLTHEPDAYRHALGGMFQAMLPGEKSHQVLGHFIADFNRTAAAKGLPTAQEWAAAGLHIGGIETEFSTASGFGGLPGIKQSNRGFGYFGDILRLDGAGKLIERNKGTAPLNAKMMSEFANSQNLMTGWSPNKFGGDLGQLAFFAPRFFQSQLETVGHALDPRGWMGMPGKTMTHVEARAQLRNLVAVGVLMTAAANTLTGDDTFDWFNPMANGHVNPNFMRIRAGGPLGDVSLFGPWDSLFKGFAATVLDGDKTYLLRTKASPVISLALNQILGEDMVGTKVPQVTENIQDGVNLIKSTVTGTEFQSVGDWKPAVWAEYVTRAMGPFSMANQVADLASGKTDLTTGAIQVGAGSTGLKASPLSPTEQVEQKRQDIVDSLIQDGTIPADKAEMFKLPFHELPSGMQKYINQQAEAKYPDQFKEWKDKRIERGNVFAERTAAADVERERYKVEFNKLTARLFAGENPYDIWNAAETMKDKLAGALVAVYDGKGAEEYKKSVEGLPITDARRLENNYNNIVKIAGGGKAIESYNSDDWDRVDELQKQFVEGLRVINPDAAKMFEYNLELKDQLNLEQATPLLQLRKMAQTTLQPYYTLRDGVVAGTQDADAPLSWLRNNPQADYLRWLTTKPSTHDSELSLNSVESAAMAVGVFGKTDRDVRLAGSNLKITSQNLTTLQQYGNEIKQLNETPATRQQGNRTIYARTELRRHDALYDALYFWLGYNKPAAGEDSVPVYHVEAVNRYLDEWGPRSDGAKPKRAN